MMNSPQAGQDFGHTQSIKQVQSKKTDFGTVLRFNELVPNAGMKRAYLQSALDEKIMLLQKSFDEIDSPKNTQQEQFEVLQLGRSRNEENHNPRLGKQPEQRVKVNEQLNNHERSNISLIDQTKPYNDEADLKHSESDSLKHRSTSVEQRQLNLENLQMQELQEQKQMRQKQMGRAEQNLLNLMEENSRLQKKIQAQKSLVQHRRFQSLVTSGSIHQSSFLEKSQYQPDDSHLDIRDSNQNRKFPIDNNHWNDYEQPIKSHRNSEKETTTSKDDSRIEEDLKVLTEYNNALQDKLNAMQEETIKNEAELKHQIRALKEGSHFDSTPQRTLREYEQQVDEQKAFKSQITIIQQQLKHLEHRFQNKQTSKSYVTQTNMASQMDYKEELRLMNKKFDSLREAVFKMSRALAHEPQLEKEQRASNKSVDFDALRALHIQQTPDMIRRHISRSSISNLLQDARGTQERSSDYQVPKHISAFKQHSQLKHQHIQLREPDIHMQIQMLPKENILSAESNQRGQISNKESRGTFESAYIFTPAKSQLNSNGIPSLNISADRKAYESPYQQSKQIPINIKRLPNVQHKVEQIGNTYSIKAVETGIPTLQFLQKKNDKLEIHMWDKDGLDKNGLTQKLGEYASKRKQTQYNI